MPASLTSNLTKDPGINKFKKTNLYYATDPYVLYQDPTWLGFKLLFFFDQPTSKLLSKVGSPLDSSKTEVQPLDNTAYAYLTRIGEKDRASYLAKFVDHLEQINNKTPWFFQTIEGLGDAWKRGYHEDEFKSLLPKDRKISIGCLESIDLRMSALMDLYRKACFDWKYRREIVPWNLRTFTVYIYVYELRNINRTGKPSPSGMLDLSKLAGIPDINEKQQKENEALLGKDPLANDDGKNPMQALKDKVSSLASAIKSDPIKGIKSALNPGADGNESANTINPNINRFLFKFSNCEFLPDESSAVLDKVSSVIGSEGEAATQKMVFSYKDVEEVNLYNIYNGDAFVSDYVVRILDQSALDNPTTLGNLAKKTDEGGKGYGLQGALNGKYNMLLPFASLAADKIERLLSSYAGKLLMGNIYGFSATNVAGAVSGILSGDPTAVLNGASSIVGAIAGSKSKRNNDSTQKLGNVYKQ